jgi:hypothetical protein
MFGLRSRSGLVALKAPAVLVGLVVKGHPQGGLGLVVKAILVGLCHLIGNLVGLSAFGGLYSPHGPQRLTLSALDFAGIGAAAALEV